MPISDTINKVRQRGASDEQILRQLESANPQWKGNIETALSRGVRAKMIIDDIVAKTSTTPSVKGGIEQIKDTAASTFESLKERGGVLKETFQQVAEGEINPLRGAVRAVGTGIGAVNDVAAGAAVGAVKAITPASVEQKAGQAVTGFLSTNVGKAGLSAVQSGLEAYEKWKSNNEEAAKDLEAVVNIAEIFPVGKGVVGAGKVASKAAVGAGKAAETAVQMTKEVIKDTPEQIAKKVAAQSGKALQPATAVEAARGAEGLKYVDLTDVKTYEELEKRSADAIKKMSEAVKVRTDANPTPYMASALGKDSGFVSAALSDMMSVYGKARMPDDFNRVKALMEKFDGSGLTTTEINEVAKEYGTTFKRKAFKPNGEPATTWAGEGYENTRKAIKDVSRSLMPDDAARNLDEAMSKVYVVKDSAKDLSEAAMKLENKSVHPNVAQKAMGAIGGVLQVIGVRDFIKKIIPSLVQTSDTTLSAVELEKSLAETLKRVQKLNGLKGDELTKELVSLAEEASTNAKAARAMQKTLPAGTTRLGTPDTSGMAQMSKETAESIAAGKYRPPNTKALPAPSAIYAPEYKGARPTVLDVEVFDKIKKGENTRWEKFNKAAQKNKPIPYR